MAQCCRLHCSPNCVILARWHQQVIIDCHGVNNPQATVLKMFSDVRYLFIFEFISFQFEFSAVTARYLFHLDCAEAGHSYQLISAHETVNTVNPIKKTIITQYTVKIQSHGKE